MKGTLNIEYYTIPKMCEIGLWITLAIIIFVIPADFMGQM